MAIFTSLILVSVWLAGLYNLGYIFVAKILGFTVSRILIGSGWTFYKFTLGTTTFELRAMPLYSMVTVERPEVTLKRLIVTCSGPMTMLFFAFFFAWLQLVVGVEKVVPRGAVVVESKASVSDLRPGDVIIEAAGQPIESGLDLSQKLASWQSGELVLTVTTGTEVHQAKLAGVSEANDKTQPLGIVFRSVTERTRLGPVEALKKTPEAIVKLVTGLLVTEGSLGSPYLYHTSPTISTSLAILVVGSLGFALFNLIPSPPAVGGDALAIAIQLIRRRRRRYDFARAKAIAGIVGLVIIGILIGSVLCTIFSATFLALWALFTGSFFLDNAARAVRPVFGARVIIVLLLILLAGIPLTCFITRRAGFSLPSLSEDRTAQIVRWTELNRYWLK